jgi:hypothetical protein
LIIDITEKKWPQRHHDTKDHKEKSITLREPLCLRVFVAKINMNHLRKSFLSGSVTLVLLILFTSPALSQESVLSSSENASGVGGTVSFSVGQVAYHALQSAEGAITEGVQQPYEILFMTGIPDIISSFSCVIYPNPAVSEVMLRIEAPKLENCSYQVHDSRGLLLMEDEIEDRETSIPLNKFPPGNYMITLMKENVNQITWKIIKK